MGILSGLPFLRNYRSMRASSYDRTGGNRDCILIPAGQNEVIANLAGPGCIRHIWITLQNRDRYHLRKIVLRMYWDGESSPSVEAPFGDFFGIGHALAHHFISIPLSETCERGFNCYFPMPFAHSARIEIENPCEISIPAFYYHIDYEVYDQPLKNTGYFHAQWHREAPCKAVPAGINLDGKENYIILEASGRGHFVGCGLHVHTQEPGWFGEGDDMIFVDGDTWPPSLHGTGTEDYFGAAWGFNREFCGPYHGLPLRDEENGKYSMYRFHLEEAVAFQQSIRVTIEHGHANDRGDDYSSVAYWYQTEPHARFPPLPDIAGRLPLDAKEPHIEVTDKRPFNEMLAAVRQVPTRIDQVEDRFKVMMSWIHDLMERGINIDPVFPMSLGRKMDDLIATHAWVEAAPIIDEVVKGLGDLEKKVES